jgi:DNA-directed RNA polymerase subunit H
MSLQQTTSQRTSILNKSREIILELLRRQDYVVDDYENFSMSDIHAMMVNNQMDMLVNSRTTVSKKAYIKYFIEQKPIRPNTLTSLIDELFGGNGEESVLNAQTDTLIIIMNDEPNDALVNKIKYEYDTNGIFIVCFNIARLQFNVLDHELVPPHRIITEEEVKNITQTYNIKRMKQLPEISRFDPVAMAIFMRPGQVCEIVRDSSTAVSTKFYRYCI